MRPEIVAKFNQQFRAIDRSVQGIREFLDLPQGNQNIAASIEQHIRGIMIAAEQLLPLCEEVGKDYSITTSTTIPAVGEKTTLGAVESKGPVESSLTIENKKGPESQ